MPDPVIAPYVPSYATTQPYITAAEYRASAQAVNTSTITPGLSTEVNADSLNETIARASSWVDSICNQKLAATLERESGLFLLRDGYLRVPVSSMPIVQVNGWSTGSNPSDLQAAEHLSGLIIEKNVLLIPVSGGYAEVGYSAGRVYVVVDYVAGFANALLTAASASGTNSLTVNSTVGIVPGLPMTIFDPGKDEQVVVQSVVGSVVTLTAPLTKQHDIGVNVSALPGAAKQATILLTTALVKGRGAQSIIQSGMQGTPSTKMLNTIDGTEEVERARSLLTQFVRVA